MRVSVICSTYNSAAWLQKVLWGYCTQSHSDFEIVVADDGSTDRTAHVIGDAMRSDGLTIQHVWHEHRGFRKCRALNAAILRATSEYLVFTDGDCVPRRDFLAQHVRQALPGHFTSGGCVRLTRSVSEGLIHGDIASGHAFNPLWLMRRGTLTWLHVSRLLNNQSLAGLLDCVTPTRPTWNGHNSGCWKKDIISVNAFDERMGYGGLDREMGERLENGGIRPKQIRHRAVCLHLDHSRTYVTAEGWARNNQIRCHTRKHKLSWTSHGIIKGPRTMNAAEQHGMPGTPTARPKQGQRQQPTTRTRRLTTVA